MEIYLLISYGIGLHFLKLNISRLMTNFEKKKIPQIVRSQMREEHEKYKFKKKKINAIAKHDVMK